MMGLNTAAIMPKLPAIPNKEPVYFGPRSAWLTPKPPAPSPEHMLVRHSKVITNKIESWKGRRNKNRAAPKKIPSY